MIERVKQIVSRISMECLGVVFSMRAEHDNKNPSGRIFLQIIYEAPCTKTGENKEWHGRKWYLSEHMTDDEIFKTGFAAFESAVKHEIMEGYKIDGIILFNPHVKFDRLLEISNDEISRL